MVAHSLTAPAPNVGEGHSSRVSLNEIWAAGLRFDASAYCIEARLARDAVSQCAHPSVPAAGPGGLCRVVSKPIRMRRIDVDAACGTPLLSSSDIIDVDLLPKRWISTKLTPRLGEMLIKPWDVLVSRSGTIGNVALAGPRLEGWALSEHALRLSFDDNEVAGFVSAFLRSRYGRPQVTGIAYGSVVVHIEPEHLSRIVVPVLSSSLLSHIGLLMMEAVRMRERAAELLAEARQGLLSTLNLEDLTKHAAQQTSTVRLSDLEGRFEATYHSDVARRAEEYILESGVTVTTIGDPQVSEAVDEVTRFRKRVFVREGGIPMLGSKQLFQIDPIDVKRLARGAHLKDLPEIQLEAGMVLVTCSGTVGRVHYVPNYMSGWTASQHANRIVPNRSIGGGYIYAWLSSQYGQALLKRYEDGSVVPELDRDMLATVPIPIIDATRRHHVDSLVRQAGDLRTQAWEAERRAIGEVEAAIRGQ